MGSRDRRGALASLVAVAMAACSGAPTAPSHAMSARQLDRAAAGQEAEASQHVAAARAETQPEHCLVVGGSDPSDVCWTSMTHPTEQTLREASDHRRQAAAERAASQALRDVEGRACVGVRDHDRDISPFAHREDIARVTPVLEGGHAAGATIVFRAVPGMTVAGLQRIVDCHIARNDVAGHRMAGMSDCPLVPAGVTAHVESTADGIAVTVRAGTEAAREDVLRRAARLVEVPAPSAMR